MRQLENLIRNLAATSDSITVITGTLFESSEPESIGLNQVAVPTHFYKAILIHRGTNKTMLAAILLWSCIRVRVPGLEVTLSTRTCSFSSTTLFWAKAARAQKMRAMG